MYLRILQTDDTVSANVDKYELYRQKLSTNSSCLKYILFFFFKKKRNTLYISQKTVVNYFIIIMYKNRKKAGLLNYCDALQYVGPGGLWW